jgi:protein-tyrosine-phosphatase
VALIIDDGPCRHATASTVVRPVGDYPEVLREGAIARSLVLDECGPTTLIVCSGNTCRSPMARVLLQGMLKERVESERQKRGLPVPAVCSAGMAAMDGFPASHFAVQAVSGPGASLADHVARRITPILIREADFILVVSDSIAAAVLQRVPDAADRITVLNAAGGGIPDPFGGSLEDYQRCADALRNELEAFLDQHHARFLGVNSA